MTSLTSSRIIFLLLDFFSFFPFFSNPAEEQIIVISPTLFQYTSLVFYMSASRFKSLAFGLRRPFASSGHSFQSALAIRLQQNVRRLGQRQFEQGPPSVEDKRETKNDSEIPESPEVKWVVFSRITQIAYGMVTIYIIIMEYRRDRRMANEQREHECTCAAREVDAAAIADDRIWREE